MPGRFSYTILAKYPRLRPEDVAIWERYILKFPNQYQTADYDFKVGDGAEAPPGLDESMTVDLKMLTQKRIDVIGYFGNQIDIIEVKPRAGASAIGDVIAYEHLYRKDNPVNGAWRKVVVSG